MHPLRPRAASMALLLVLGSLAGCGNTPKELTPEEELKVDQATQDAMRDYYGGPSGNIGDGASAND